MDRGLLLTQRTMPRQQGLRRLESAPFLVHGGVVMSSVTTLVVPQTGPENQLPHPTACIPLKLRTLVGARRDEPRTPAPMPDSRENPSGQTAHCEVVRPKLPAHESYFTSRYRTATGSAQEIPFPDSTSLLCSGVIS